MESFETEFNSEIAIARTDNLGCLIFMTNPESMSKDGKVIV